MNTAILLFGLGALDVANGGKSFAVVLGDELLGGRISRFAALLELELRLALKTTLLFEVPHRRALEKTCDEVRLKQNKII